MVKASNWSMTLLLSTSPANRVTAGSVTVPPAVSVTAAWALRKPPAVATAAYAPAGAVRLKVPSGLAVTDVTSMLPGLKRLLVTGLPASTFPLSWPAGRGVGEATGVKVFVAVGSGVNVGNGVEVGTGVK